MGSAWYCTEDVNKGSSYSVLIREEPDRIPDDDMGEVNGQNIEDKATTDVVVAEIDGSVLDVILAMVKWTNVYSIESTRTQIETGSAEAEEGDWGKDSYS